MVPVGVAKRHWLLDQVGLEVYLDEVLASPAATAEHVRSLLNRREAARMVAEGLSRRRGLHEHPGLVGLAVEATNRLGHQDALRLARRWPDGQPVSQELVCAILDRAVHVPPQPPRLLGQAGPPSRSPSTGRGCGCYSAAPLLPEVAGRYPRVQAVLLEDGETSTRPWSPRVCWSAPTPFSAWWTS